MIGFSPRWVIKNPLIAPATKTTPRAVRAALHNRLSVVCQVGADHDRKGDSPGHGKVDATLLDDQCLSQPGDDQDGGVREHSEEGSAADARRRDQGPHQEQQDGRHHHSHEAAMNPRQDPRPRELRTVVAESGTVFSSFAALGADKPDEVIDESQANYRRPIETASACTPGRRSLWSGVAIPLMAGTTKRGSRRSKCPAERSGAS